MIWIIWRMCFQLYVNQMAYDSIRIGHRRKRNWLSTDQLLVSRVASILTGSQNSICNVTYPPSVLDLQDEVERKRHFGFVSWDIENQLQDELRLSCLVLSARIQKDLPSDLLMGLWTLNEVIHQSVIEHYFSVTLEFDTPVNALVWNRV
jgi:hypothetical protein